MNTENTELYNELPAEFRQMVDNWPYDCVVHKDIPQFTSGGLTKRRVSDLLSQGVGPETFRILNKKASDKVKFTYWLWQRTKHGRTKRSQKDE